VRNDIALDRRSKVVWIAIAREIPKRLASIAANGLRWLGKYYFGTWLHQTCQAGNPAWIGLWGDQYNPISSKYRWGTDAEPSIRDDPHLDCVRRSEHICGRAQLNLG